MFYTEIFTELVHIFIEIRNTKSSIRNLQNKNSLINVTLQTRLIDLKENLLQKADASSCK